MRKTLNAINEATQLLVPPNADNSKPTGKKQGDTIKILKDIFVGTNIGDIYRIERVQGTYKDPQDPSKGTWLHTTVIKVLKNGTLSTSLQSTLFLQDKDLDKLVQNAKVLQPNKPYTQGELTIEEIQDALKHMGIPRLAKLPMKSLLSTSTKSIIIPLDRLNIDVKMKQVIFNKIMRYILKQQIPYTFYSFQDKTKEMPKDGYTSIYLEKGGN